MLVEGMIYNKMSSVMPFTFNAVDLYVVTINGKPWARARDVCRHYSTTKNCKHCQNHFSKENYVQKYQTSGVPTAVTPAD